MKGEKSRMACVQAVVAMLAKDFQSSYRDLDTDKSENWVWF